MTHDQYSVSYVYFIFCYLNFIIYLLLSNSYLIKKKNIYIVEFNDIESMRNREAVSAVKIEQESRSLKLNLDLIINYRDAYSDCRFGSIYQ